MDEARTPRRLAGRLASRLRRGDQKGETESTPEPEQPLVTVVVPVYAVEEYVDECLTSILGQTYSNLEVLVVDDGSPDGSMDIVARRAETDDRIRIVRQTNAGLGAARNRGIEESTGDLITFVDSDDTIPVTALAHHVRSLVRSGSDFSVGALERQQHETSYVQKPWSRRLHEVLRRAVTVEEVPEAMANVFACTKVFRREFVEEIDLRFPVGVRYEDQVPVTRAYLKARTFDILPDIVYSWRSRRDGSSITQQKARKDDLHDRLMAVDEVYGMMRAHGSSTVLQAWYGKVFEFDLMAYIRASIDADDDYYATLAETVGHVLDGAPHEAWTYVDLRHRLAAWALVHEGRATLTRLLDSPLLTGNIPVQAAGDGLAADTDALGLPEGIPVELLAVTDRDLLVEARLDDLRWESQSLVVRGVAFTRYVDSDLPHEVSLSLQRPRGGDGLTVPTTRQRIPDANVFADRHYEDHRDDGFEARIPAGELVALSGEGTKSVWHTRVTCDTVGGSRSAVFRDRVGHGGAVAPQRVVVDGTLVEAQWSDRLGLVVQLRRDWVILTGLHESAEGVTLELGCAEGVVPRRVLVQKEPTGPVVADDNEPGRYRTLVRARDLPDLDDAMRRLMVETDDGRQPIAVLAGLDACPLPSSDLALLTGDGFLRVGRRTGVLAVDGVDFADNRVRLSGSVVGEAPAELALAGPRASTAGPVSFDAGRWTVDLPLTRTSVMGDELPVPRDLYRIDAGEERSVVVDPQQAARVVGAGVGAWAARLLDDNQFAVERSRGDEIETHTRHGQHRLQSGVYAAVRGQERRPLVLFDSFVGRGGWHGCGAVVRALVEAHPDLELAWSVRDESLPVPAGVVPVIRNSAEWYDRLGAASHVVTNGTMPRYFVKAPGQRVVQLWTGTPVTRFGHAVPVDEGTAPEIRALDRDVVHWDVLYTGGPDGTAWMRQATAFPGEVREVGHPSLDAYAHGDREAKVAAVRARLGLGDGPVLLYAPTTRHAVRAHTKREKIAHFEADTVRSAVPGLNVLHRGHPNTANQAVAAQGPGVLDVTLYPELSDLVLLADAVVTDYSALVVDVLASDTPLGLLAPDLEDFAERGFFPDLFQTPPGVVARTTEDLLPWLTGGLETTYEGRELLRKQLLPLDDGHAAARIVAAEWGS